MSKLSGLDLAVEFPLYRGLREKLNLPDKEYSLRGQLMLHSPKDTREKLHHISPLVPENKDQRSAGTLYGAALLHSAYRMVMRQYTRQLVPQVWSSLDRALHRKISPQKINEIYLSILNTYPGNRLYHYKVTPEELLFDPEKGDLWRQIALEQILLLRLSGENETLKSCVPLQLDRNWEEWDLFRDTADVLEEELDHLPGFSKEQLPLPRLLRRPMEEGKDLEGQLRYIRENWGEILDGLLPKLLGSLDLLAEENQVRLPGPGPTEGVDFTLMEEDYARYSIDSSWMPRVILLAKNALVWLHQLSRKYEREIPTLGEIPDEELDQLAEAGFTGLWLIGLWERSPASRRIKVLCGNPEAESSAYSLFSYHIAERLGGDEALNRLKERCTMRGIRLASDMVPNHCGIDSDWVRSHPEWFISLKENPYRQYSFKGENLSQDPELEIYLEDHYYNKTDCAVVFKRVEKSTKKISYIYHGNDGTSMPWNDTAQIDFLHPQAREEVIQQILEVARKFPIIRFDAAMVLARKHIRRLWYPKAGEGGAIPTRSEQAMSDADFYQAIPEEFWRDVVKRVSEECPDTLLLAEAFWMMEGYFVRNLGMHRVYNSAFMNMIKDEKNDEFRKLIKNTLDYDPKILKRYVNFMSNPDEDTADAQFGRDDKYFGVFALMLTLPGLPMVGHGQLEGYREKYGMEYSRAYYDEVPDQGLMERHRREIYPIMKNRRLFAGAKDFHLFDCHHSQGTIQHQVLAYSNRFETQSALFIFNNRLEESQGNIHYAYGKDYGLSQALGLSGDPSNFVIFREHRSGLWFIRNCADIFNQGMFYQLSGYEYQLFARFQEIPDDEEYIYSAICSELNGSGTASIEQSLKDHRLKPLYRILNPFLNQENLRELGGSLHQKKLVLPEFLKDRKEITRWIKRLEHHLRRKIPAGKEARKLQKKVRRVLRIWRSLYHFRKQELPGEFLLQEEFAHILAYWLVLESLERISGISGAQLLKDWDILHQLEKNGTGPSLLPYNAETLFKALFELPRWDKKKDQLGGLCELFDTALFQECCGVNLYDQILWFNQQGFEEITTLLLVQSRLRSTVWTRLFRRNRIWKTLHSWLEKYKESEFRVQHMHRNHRSRGQRP